MAADRHLYLVVHPNHSLVASQLDAEHFIRHYVRESARYFEGRLAFVELDPGYRHPYFDIDLAYSELKAHDDGSPKATKFVSSYRVLEHVELSAMGALYLADQSGGFVALEPSRSGPAPGGGELRVVLEIDPVRFIVLTRLGLAEYARFATDSANSKGAPAMLYTELDLSVDDFLSETEEGPYSSSFFPGIHPERLRFAARELARSPGKAVKGIALYCPFDRVSYKLLRGGFVFASRGEPGLEAAQGAGPASAASLKYYPLLPLEEVERRYYKFWKAM